MNLHKTYTDHLLIPIGLLGIVNFISWNYFGLALIVVLAIKLQILSSIRKIKTLLIQCLFLFSMAFVFNVSALFWLFNVGWKDALLAYMGNSFVMLLPLFLIVNARTVPINIAILIWPLFELANEFWFWSWPWLTFGNALGGTPEIIQWYSYVGSFGGSIWLISVSIFVVEAVKRGSTLYIVFCLATIIAPISLSIYSYILDTTPNQVNDVFLYTSLKNSEPNQAKIKKMYQQIFLKKDSLEVDYIITPEVFLSGAYIKASENKDVYPYIQAMTFLAKNATLVIGSEFKYNGRLYNGSWLFKNERAERLKIKQKLVPLREYTPFFLRFFLGDTYYSTHTPPTIKPEMKSNVLICYESAFSSYTAYQSLGQKFIILLASEHFMHNSFYGERQYTNMLRIRAIENGKSLVKCSSGGVSYLIRKNGAISDIMKGNAGFLTVEINQQATLYQLILQKISTVI